MKDSRIFSENTRILMKVFAFTMDFQAFAMNP